MFDKNPSFLRLSKRSILRQIGVSALLGLALTLLVPTIYAQTTPPADPKKEGPMLRILCVSSLVEEEFLTIANRDEKGAWREFGKAKLRSSFVSDWLPAATGPLDLVKGSGENLSSVCRFTFPEGVKRVVVVLLPDTQKKVYQADVIEPSKLQFAKGSTLLVNYSRLTGAVMLGTARSNVKPGERMVAKPVPEANGMFRMLVAYTNPENKIVPCYDRYLQYSRDSREFLLLFPDATTGLRVYSLSEFGPYE